MKFCAFCFFPKFCVILFPFSVLRITGVSRLRTYHSIISAYVTGQGLDQRGRQQLLSGPETTDTLEVDPVEDGIF